MRRWRFPKRRERLQMLNRTQGIATRRTNGTGNHNSLNTPGDAANSIDSLSGSPRSCDKLARSLREVIEPPLRVSK